MSYNVRSVRLCRYGRWSTSKISPRVSNCAGQRRQSTLAHHPRNDHHPIAESRVETGYVHVDVDVDVAFKNLEDRFCWTFKRIPSLQNDSLHTCLYISARRAGQWLRNSRKLRKLRNVSKGQNALIKVRNPFLCPGMANVTSKIKGNFRTPLEVSLNLGLYLLPWGTFCFFRVGISSQDRLCVIASSCFIDLESINFSLGKYNFHTPGTINEILDSFFRLESIVN